MTVEVATILLGLPIMHSKEWVFYKGLVCKGATSAPNIKKKRFCRYWSSIMAGEWRSIDWIINITYGVVMPKTFTMGEQIDQFTEIFCIRS